MELLRHLQGSYDGYDDDDYDEEEYFSDEQEETDVEYKTLEDYQKEQVKDVKLVVLNVCSLFCGFRLLFFPPFFFSCCFSLIFFFAGRVQGRQVAESVSEERSSGQRGRRGARVQQHSGLVGVSKEFQRAGQAGLGLDAKEEEISTEG